jgi:hypothetical protein
LPEQVFNLHPTADVTDAFKPDKAAVVAGAPESGAADCADASAPGFAPPPREYSRPLRESSRFGRLDDLTLRPLSELYQFFGNHFIFDNAQAGVSAFMKIADEKLDGVIDDVAFVRAELLCADAGATVVRGKGDVGMHKELVPGYARRLQISLFEKLIGKVARQPARPDAFLIIGVIYCDEQSQLSPSLAWG